jgi:hypothetical protein
VHVYLSFSIQALLLRVNRNSKDSAANSQTHLALAVPPESMQPMLVAYQLKVRQQNGFRSMVCSNVVHPEFLLQAVNFDF